MVRLSPTSKYAAYEYDEYEVPAEVMEQVIDEFKSLPGWKEKKGFLDKIMNEESTSSDLFNWAHGTEDEVMEELRDHLWEKLQPLVREKAKEMGGGHNEDLFFEEIDDKLWPSDIAWEASHRVWKGEDEDKVLRDELDKVIDASQRDILLNVQEALKDEMDYGALRDTVRHMQTPEEMQRTEIPTEPKKLENIPSDQGLGSLSCRSPGMKKEAVSPSSIIRALKKDKHDEAKDALTDFIRHLPWGTTPDKELHMTPDEYKEFVNAIKTGRLHKARKLMRVEKDNPDIGDEWQEKWDEKWDKPKNKSGLLDIVTEEDEKRLDKIDKERGGEYGQYALPDWKELEEETRKLKRGGEMLVELFKLAQSLDKKGEYELANEVDEIIKELSQRAGITPDEMIALANDLDTNGEVELADKLDNVLAKGKYKTWKGKGEKPPKGAEHKAPKGWFDKMKKDVKKKNPDYSAKRISEIVGDIWDNELSDAKRKQIYNRYGKKKSPNK